MKAPIYSTRYNYGAGLSFDRTASKWSNEDYEVGSGVYIGRYFTVKIFSHTGTTKQPAQTQLEVYHGDNIHCKTYHRVFTNRGLCKIAAAFIEELLDEQKIS